MTEMIISCVVTCMNVPQFDESSIEQEAHYRLLVKLY